MGFLLPWLLGLGAGLLLAAAGCAIAQRRQVCALAAAHAERDRARAAAAAALRTVRLAAIELRGPATALLGHADRLRADGMGPEPMASIGAIAGMVLDLADDLQHHALAEASDRVLHPEPIDLAALLRDAVAAVTAGLGPSRRHWRLPAALDGITVLVDRRAMAQILARVLGNAARFSRHDDWIDISVETADGQFTLVVADEGSGVAAAAGVGAPGQRDSRGLGLGLALARVLMQAHGGALAIEAAPAIGTRVTLAFPATRVVQRVTEPAV